MNKRTYTLIIAALVWMLPSVQRAIAEPATDDPLRHGYALIIGNSTYRDWLPLNDVGLQIDQLSIGLRRHFDTVEVAKNLRTEELRQRINNFLRIYGNVPNARLFIYYAGHGYSEPIIELSETRGYITGIDTPSVTQGYDKVRPSAISMDEIRSLLSNALAKHILFIFDSCFSGTVFFGRSPSPLPTLRPDDGVITRDELNRLLTKRSRDIITAGDEKQIVPARSPLPELFLAALEGGADTFGRGVISAAQIQLYLADKIRLMPVNLNPMVGKLLDSRPTRGDFYFRVLPNTNIVTDGLGPSQYPKPPPPPPSLICQVEQVKDWLGKHGVYGDRPLDTSVYDDEVNWTANGKRSKKTRSQITREEDVFRKVYPVQRYVPNSSKDSMVMLGNQCVITQELHAYKKKSNGDEARNIYKVVFAIKTDANQPRIVEQEIQEIQGLARN
jgi:hypothetical protein